MSQGANRLTVGLMYALGVVFVCVLLGYGSVMGSLAVAVISSAATAMFFIPTYLNWQFQCLAKADELARSSTIASTAAFMRELREMAYRHDQEIERISTDSGKLTAQLEDARATVQRAKVLQRDPKTGRIISLPVAATSTAVRPVSAPLVILDQELPTQTD